MRAVRRALWLLLGSVLPLWSIALSNDPAVPDASPQPRDWNFEISADGVLHALDDAGRIRWSHNCTALVLPTAPSPDWRFDDEARSYWKSLITEAPFHSDQGLIVGNAATTVEVIDQTTGKLLFKFLPDGSYTRPAQVQAEPVNTLLFKQVHYSLQCLAIPEGKVNWQLNFSEITLVTYAPQASSTSLAQVHGSSPAFIKRREQERGILYAGSNYVPVPLNVRPAPSGFYGNSTHLPLPVSAFRRPLDFYGNSTYPRVPVAVFLPSPPTIKHFWDGYGLVAGLVFMFLLGLVSLLWSWMLKKRQQRLPTMELPAATVKAKKRKKRANRKDPEELQRFQEANFGLAGTEEIKALGSGVYEGRLEDMPVAAKRVPLERAEAEKAVLLDIGYHPNVVNYRSVRQIDQYVYVIVERCHYDLRGWVEQNKHQHGDEQLEKVLSLCRRVLDGIKHIHDSRYIHRDLKPENIWIHENEKKNYMLTPKIADFATCRQLPDDYDEDLEPEPGTGTEGWRAPEQVENSRSHTRAMDMFNFACLLFFCLTGGDHPFGVPDGRDGRISRGHRNTWQVDHEPLIKHLLDNLLDSDPAKRLSAGQVQEHPLFWDSEKRIKFLNDASSRVEQAYKPEDSLQDPLPPEEKRTRAKIRARMDALQPLLLGTGTWDSKLDEELVQDMEQYRKFDYTSAKDLLRAIRNKWVHYDELRMSLKTKLTRPDGFEKYFRVRFPALLMEIYKVIQDICAQEIVFQVYFNPEIS